jgi:KDO2-lipid IV(A) lauroyltransferase
MLQALPLIWVARLGRACGEVAYWIDARHRRVATQNLAHCFGGAMLPAELRALTREHFRRIGENYCCAVKTAAMSPEALRSHVEIVGVDKFRSHQVDGSPRNCVVAIGHFGNFELYVHLSQYAPGFRGAATYRALRQPALNRLMQTLRERSGCLFFERRSDAAELKAAMSSTGLLLGLLADQHAEEGGIRLPFFGRECSTTGAPAVFARRYHCPLHTAICYRTALARWRIEVGDAIPLRDGERPRSARSVMLDVNRAFEAAIRRDPANWFWVHNRWKTRRGKRADRRREVGAGGVEPKDLDVPAAEAQLP